MTVYTIGHSARPLEAFFALLTRERIQQLVDVRRYPVSRRQPQFSRERLEAECVTRKIAYAHTPALGGHRSPGPASPNAAVRNAALRGYADHMDSPEFRAALRDLIATSSAVRLAVMCAEADPGRCHRRFLADALLVAGCSVEHIVTEQTIPHQLHPHAQLAGDKLTYPLGHSRGQGQLFS
jgi:uncharacterized protein (DUF488 family)